MTKEFIYFADLFGAYFFSISGALIARRYGKLDAFGIGFVALLTAVGGGTVRDWLLNAYPIAWIQQDGYLISIVLGVVTAFVLTKSLSKLNRLINVVDTLGVAFFAMAGLEKSLHFEAGPVAAIFLGMLSGTCGGILRDITCNEIPRIFRSEWYATLLLGGGLIKVLLQFGLEVDPFKASIAGCIVIILARLYVLGHFRKLRKRIGMKIQKFRKKIGALRALNYQ
ncbi:trimeric intracellular cation channel family protein [Luteibaculum oceani]|uniref:Trimeric intracellular cation channel family protein n=1 Tax=Luteibaculum oceani TaxID=1294296 RepID=A0A5C6UZC8_9FLAO|nr:trimeric intracellular cation channel family protein [Luteibaculum oceani]TXC78793.1 trimeric intracellular cation channel family protein [Luteibaculum oceani]